MCTYNNKGEVRLRREGLMRGHPQHTLQCELEVDSKVMLPQPKQPVTGDSIMFVTEN